MFRVRRTEEEDEEAKSMEINLSNKNRNGVQHEECERAYKVRDVEVKKQLRNYS